MNFKVNYPLTQDPKNVIIAEWTNGYRKVDLYFKDRNIASFDNGLRYLKKDLIFIDTELGEIKIRFTDRPYFMNLVVDGFHSPINKNHPKHKFKLMTATFAFYIVIVIGLVALLDTGGLFKRYQLRGLTFIQAITKISIFIFIIALSHCIPKIYECKIKSYYHSLYLIFAFAIVILSITHSLFGLIWVTFFLIISSAMTLPYLTNVKLYQKHLNISCE